VAGPRVNGSGSHIPLPPSVQRARHTPAAFSSVAVCHTSNVTMLSRLPVRPMAPARAPNVSLLSAASKPRCLNEVTFSWPCICTGLPLPLNLHIGCRFNALHVSIKNDITDSFFALVSWCYRPSTSQWHGLGANEAGRDKESQLFIKAKVSNFTRYCLPWSPDPNDKQCSSAPQGLEAYCKACGDESGCFSAKGGPPATKEADCTDHSSHHGACAGARPANTPALSSSAGAASTADPFASPTDCQLAPGRG
jgi:hypothetical protein